MPISEIKIPLSQDNNGADLHEGDTVICLENNQIYKIEFGQHRDAFNGGYIYGFYIPDNCIKIDINAS